MQSLQNKYYIICTSETIDSNLNFIKEFTDANEIMVYILNGSEVDFALVFNATIITNDLITNKQLTDLTINENYQLFEKILLK